MRNDPPSFSWWNLPSNRDPRELLPIAVGHHQAGRLAEAEAAYREILTVNPNDINSLHLLGLVANQQGRSQVAIDLIGRALALKPDFAEAYGNLGAVLKAAGRLDEAAAACRSAAALKPESAKAHYALGAVLQQQGRLDDAAACYRRSLALDPTSADAHTNLGAILQEQGRLAEAAAHYEQVVSARPDYAFGHYNLGLIRQELGDPRDAISAYRSARALKPDYADAHWNEALQHLSLGDYAAGWDQYEWRWRREGRLARQFDAPQWDGGARPGQTILLHAEQGFGDTFQFIRYARVVKERCGTVIVECQPGMERVLAGASSIDSLVSRGEALPRFDCHAPLLSLPRLCETRIESIPAEIPYLHVDPALARAWRARMQAGGFNVGLAWRGNPKNTHDRRRSIAAASIAEFCDVPGINWFSLQADARPDEIGAFSGAIRDCGPLLGDWAETAALISALDLVVTVDTAVAHLGGALGKPVWVLLAFAPHWCWLRDRSDSPWYPTARLFRQVNPGDWGTVMTEVRTKLLQRRKSDLSVDRLSLT